MNENIEISARAFGLWVFWASRWPSVCVEPNAASNGRSHRMQLSWYSWLVGFGLTLLFEVPIVIWLLADTVPRLPRRLAIAVFANLLTHPLVWFFFPQLPLNGVLRLVLSEFWAFAGEALFYWTMAPPLGFGRATLVSLAANLTSFGLGWVALESYPSVLF